MARHPRAIKIDRAFAVPSKASRLHYFRLDSIVFSMISASTLIMNIGCDEGIFASDATSFGVFTQHHASCIVGLFTASAEWLEIKQTDQDNVQPFTIPEIKYHGGHHSDRKY